MSLLKDLIQTKRTTFENLRDRFNQCDATGCRPIAIRLIAIAGKGCPTPLFHPVDRLWKGVEASQFEPAPILDSTDLDNPWFQYFVAKPASMSTEQEAAFARWRVTAETAGLELANCLRASEHSDRFPSSPLVLWVNHLSQASDGGFSLPVDRDGEREIVFKDVVLASSNFSGWLASNDWPLVQPDSDSVANGGKANRKRKKNSTEDHADWEEVYRDYEKSNLKGDRKAAKKGDCTRKFQAFYESRKDLQNWTMKVAWKKTEAARKRIARRS